MKQQGDIIFIRVNGAPSKKGKPTNVSDGVIAHGELTGHAHRVMEAPGLEYTLERYEDGTMYMRAVSPVTIQHEEHRPVVLDPGEYEVRHVQVFDYAELKPRPVAD